MNWHAHMRALPHRFSAAHTLAWPSRVCSFSLKHMRALVARRVPHLGSSARLGRVRAAILQQPPAPPCPCLMLPCTAPHSQLCYTSPQPRLTPVQDNPPSAPGVDVRARVRARVPCHGVPRLLIATMLLATCVAPWPHAPAYSPAMPRCVQRASPSSPAPPSRRPAPARHQDLCVCLGT
jgi:hypothetical protein